MESQQNMHILWLLAVKYGSTGSDISSNLKIKQSVQDVDVYGSNHLV